MSDSEFKLTPKQARAEWVKALRSGEYEQNKGSLRHESNFCCLGVACDTFKEIEGVGHWNSDAFVSISDQSLYGLTFPVRQWLGLIGFHGEMDFTSLSSLNDDGSTFAEIADIIEAEPEGLIAEGAK